VRWRYRSLRWIGNQHGIRFINGQGKLVGGFDVQKIELNVKCTSWVRRECYLEKTIFLVENGNLHLNFD